MSNSKKGFTLVELLVVIGILAILTAAVVIILNPAELLRQSRDAQRLSDLDAVKSATSLYLADEKTFTTLGSTSCYTHLLAASSLAANCGGRFTASHSSTTYASSAASSTAVNGQGWIPLPYSTITSGSPISALPTDPSAGTTYFYAFAADTTSLTFEMNAKLESTKYSAKATSDGGNDTNYYETGSSLTL